MSSSALPSEILQAVSAAGGGKLALVLGAGCSVEQPTNIPVASICSEELHRLLIADNVLQSGDCANPADLSALTDAVFAKNHSQRNVVERFLARYNPENVSHLNAAALLIEGAVTSIVTLNFDLALSTALGMLGSGSNVGIINSPEDLGRQKQANVYYLHRNANSADPEVWILRSAPLQTEWKRWWQPIIITKVLATPVVLFVGLGAPAAVLIESVKLLQKALPAGTRLFQVDPGDPADSKFFQELQLTPSAYVREGWCDFMRKLTRRLVAEHASTLADAANQKVRDDHLTAEDLTGLLSQLVGMGLIGLGRLRAEWLLLSSRYGPAAKCDPGLLSDLLLAIAMIARVSCTEVLLFDTGLIEFRRDGRTVCTYAVASGSGHRGRAAVETRLRDRLRPYESGLSTPHGAIVAGTAEAWIAETPPVDVVRGEEEEGDIVEGGKRFTLFHVADLRASVSRVSEVVP